MIVRVHRWTKRSLLPLAALPIFQVVGGCDSLTSAFGAQLLSSTFNTFVASVQQVVLQSFPSADVLQVLLGVNRQPFFP